MSPSQHVLARKLALVLGGAGLVLACGERASVTPAPCDTCPADSFIIPPFSHDGVCEPAAEGIARCCNGATYQVPRLARSAYRIHEGDPGTCSNFEWGDDSPENVFVLPADEAMYPILLQMPAVTSLDGSPCAATCCVGDPGATTPTAFGLAVEKPVQWSLFVAQKRLVITAEAPWKLVSGGQGGEPYATNCLCGYQEFSPNRGTLALAYGSFGFATSEPIAEPTSIVIDLVPDVALDGDYGCTPNYVE